MEESYSVELKVNDEDIPMNEFVQKVIQNVIKGIVKTLTLKGIDKIETIEIKLESE